MERVNRILHHRLFLHCLGEIREEERNRIYCCHDLTHFLDVGRIAFILNLEEKGNIQKELIYAAALLHDIGRFIQYREGIPHEKASGNLAPEILKECGFEKEEIQDIVKAVLEHRNPDRRKDKTLSGLIYRADKQSRKCYYCQAGDTCKSCREEKERGLQY